MKDKKAFIFYFLMTIIFLDFGNQLRKISFNSFFDDFSDFLLTKRCSDVILIQNRFCIIEIMRYERSGHSEKNS